MASSGCKRGNRGMPMKALPRPIDSQVDCGISNIEREIVGTHSPTRAQIWKRIEVTAMAHHGLNKVHGLLTLIANDAARSNQTVSDWKSERSPVPRHVLNRLSALYGVTVAYLMDLTDNPNHDPFQSQDDLGPRMEEMVNNVLDRVKVSVPAKEPLINSSLSGRRAQRGIITASAINF